jgi:hypothetical protein
LDKELDEKNWESRLDACWIRFRADEMDAAELVAGIDLLAAERDSGDAISTFEKACARDSAGMEGQAEPLYRAALASGKLTGLRRTRATLQLASTLRLLHRLDESEQLLRAELARPEASADPHALPDETRALLALTLTARGHPVEAVALLLTALAPHLSRYQRSMLGCAAALGSTTG